ncbi:MAG TPA: glycosyltransferase family 9 protein, partial [Roseimicrobium sp.]|nr:glycosyltransferase family 9 protein [Roseimicrobium sp.]
MKVLILKPSSLGDVVHALPVLRLMKRQMPGASFYWWLARDLLPLLEDDRDITHIFPFERRRWSSIWNAHELLGSIQDMRSLKPDLVLDLQGLARSAAFAWGTNADKVVGLADAREGATALYDVRVKTTQRHAVDRYLSVVKHLGCTVDADFDWLPAKEGWSHLVSEQLPWSDAPLVAICPGARWVTKVWPATHFSDAVQLISKNRPDVKFVVVGGRDERTAGEMLARAYPDHVISVAGQTS